MRDAARDRMRRGHRPHQLPVVALPPAQAARRTHESDEDLREVRRVQRDEPHAPEDVSLDPLDHLVRDGVVPQMTPPQQHVRRRQSLLVEAVLGVVERRRLDHRTVAEQLAQAGGDRAVHRVGVDALRHLVVLLVVVLAPHEHSDGSFRRHRPSSPRSTSQAVLPARASTGCRCPVRQMLVEHARSATDGPATSTTVPGSTQSRPSTPVAAKRAASTVNRTVRRAPAGRSTRAKPMSCATGRTASDGGTGAYGCATLTADSPRLCTVTAISAAPSAGSDDGAVSVSYSTRPRVSPYPNGYSGVGSATVMPGLCRPRGGSRYVVVAAGVRGICTGSRPLGATRPDRRPAPAAAPSAPGKKACTTARAAPYSPSAYGRPETTTSTVGTPVARIAMTRSC